MPDSASKTPTGRQGDHGNVGEAVDLVKSYVRQETIGPLQGIARWLAFGVAGALMLSLGMVLVLLGVLRLVQTEVTSLDGAWSWVPYVIALAVGAIFTVAALTRIKKTSLGKER